MIVFVFTKIGKVILKSASCYKNRQTVTNRQGYITNRQDNIKNQHGYIKIGMVILKSAWLY